MWLRHILHSWIDFLLSIENEWNHSSLEFVLLHIHFERFPRVPQGGGGGGGLLIGIQWNLGHYSQFDTKYIYTIKHR